MRSDSARRYAGRGRLPVEFGLAGGALTMIVAALLDSAIFPPEDKTARLMIMAGAIAAACVVLADWRSGLPVAVVGYLLFNGFLVNRYGELSWHGSAGLRGTTVIMSAAYAGLLAGWWRRPSPYSGVPVIHPRPASTPIEMENHDG
jgi:hypothetical protein